MYPPPKRPLGITLLAIPFVWIGCMGTLIFPLMILAGIGRTFWQLLTPYLFHSKALSLTVTTLLLIIWLGGYVLYAFIGFGLWKLRRWALKATVIVNSIAIAMGVIVVAFLVKLEPLLAVPMAIGLVIPYAGILWYLRRPNVRAAFGLHAPIPAMPSKPRKTWVIVTVAVSAFVILIALFVCGLLLAVDKSFRRSDIYAMSLDRARSSPCVVAKLGTPIIAKGMIGGSISSSTYEGSADMRIPVHGPNGSGSLDVEGKKIDGHWTIDTLDLMHDEGQIHLVPASPCP